ncbi:MAG TPA: WbqC family protein [Bacteroidia bacterium]|nr:WbqC family protein [Bacteroidia bacterium]
MNGIFTTAYAAPISYYKLLLQCNTQLLELNEHFIKQTIRNRCEIATSNGKLILTVPLSQRKNNMIVKDVCVSYQNNWQRQHIKSLETAYQSSPFFEFFFDDLKLAYQFQPKFLTDWNYSIHQMILNWLKLKIEFVQTDSYHKVYENTIDFRKNEWSNYETLNYHQVFESKHGFISHLSIYDLIFNCGNQALSHLK